MGINLTGFATGFAKTLATRIEDEREKEEKILSNRFNLAATNRLARQKEADELRKVYESRVKNFSSAYPMASEEQIAAAISTETNYNTLMKAHEEGFSIDEKVDVLDKYVTVGKMPETFTTAMGLVQQTVQPKVGAVDRSERQTKKLLGFIDVSPGEGKRQRYAEQYGVSADELEAYAEGVPTVSDLGSLGSVSSEFLKAPESPDARLKNLRLALMDAETEDEKETLKRQIDETVSNMNYGTNPKTLTEEVNRVSLALEDETDPAKIAMLNKKLDSLNKRIQSNTKAQAQEKDRAKEFGGAVRTYSETRKMVEDAQVAALGRLKGITEDDRKRFIAETPDGPKMRKIRPEDRPEIAAIAREAALDALRSSGHIRPDGSMTDYARDILIGLGLFVNGKIIPDPMAAIKSAEDERRALQEKRDREAKEKAAAAVAPQQGKAPPPSTPSGSNVVVKNWE